MASFSPAFSKAALACSTTSRKGLSVSTLTSSSMMAGGGTRRAAGCVACEPPTSHNDGQLPVCCNFLDSRQVRRQVGMCDVSQAAPGQGRGAPAQLPRC
ncbi:hypothetical protein RirG_059600 [Rhizophagus irregularis DAOM 197198w]|uniref:Uncharacterized protein n=1 Tax=Rhizophagus irregularis (strain DAOM 197198w) TaxID=1432141 RepID=A0A015LLE5_RHIIW|nr:hypothetical protein RirG_059600 [Rhizophagus irregularis DAOM 197198w]